MARRMLKLMTKMKKIEKKTFWENNFVILSLK